jgi:hypothetical protein
LSTLCVILHCKTKDYKILKNDLFLIVVIFIATFFLALFLASKCNEEINHMMKNGGLKSVVSEIWYGYENKK